MNGHSVFHDQDRPFYAMLPPLPQMTFTTEGDEKKKVDIMIEILNARQQRANMVAKDMRNIFYQLQHATAIQATSEGAIQQRVPEHVDMSLHYLNGSVEAERQPWGLPYGIDTSLIDEASVPERFHLQTTEQYSEALPTTAQTGLTGIEQLSHWQKLASHDYNRKMRFTHEDVNLFQAVTPDCSNAIGSGMSYLPHQPMSFNTFAPAAAGVESRAVGSPSEVGVPNVSTLRQGGYRCECGHETRAKGDMVRHRQSLRHSERNHVCSCGKAYTRQDSLRRHKKVCRKQYQ